MTRIEYRIRHQRGDGYAHPENLGVVSHAEARTVLRGKRDLMNKSGGDGNGYVLQSRKVEQWQDER